MRRTFEQLLDSPAAPYWAAAASLVLGLTFVFVWAPHPWSWEGIDQYHDLARGLARGDGFATTDVPWGLAAFVAACYVVFGEQPWIPVTIQVVANATVPLMLYRLVRPWVERRTAALAALLVGVFSFNTVYASTQASDALCTVLFLASLVTLAHAHRTGRRGYFALSGFLAGVVPQFRPNMLLLPLVIAAAYLLFSRTPRRAAHMAWFLALFAAALSPWVVRNYSLTGTFLPTSTHGGVQLWYGSLQVGPYLESRAHNPRSVFESPAFDYTSISGQPIVITADAGNCDFWREGTIELVYWTDRAPRHARLQPLHAGVTPLRFEIPAQPAPTAIYYYFETKWRPAADAGPGAPPPMHELAPAGGASNPFVYFVADEHLTDLDRHGDLLDVFDLIRVVRHLAWREPLPFADRLDFDRDGSISDADLRRVVVLLLGDGATPDAVAVSPLLEVASDAAHLRLADGSVFTVPREFSGRVTDTRVEGQLARSLVAARRSFTSVATPPSRRAGPCTLLGDVRVNDVFYRKDPHQMQRYLALAFDNIQRDPGAFAAASAYRVGRLFVIRGEGDQWTTYQFDGSRLVYLAGLTLSLTYLALFLAGVIVAVRTRSRLLVLLVPILYVPMTICFVLTNMRYTVTVQPLMFAFVALAVLAALGLSTSPPESQCLKEPDQHTPLSPRSAARRVISAPSEGTSSNV